MKEKWVIEDTAGVSAQLASKIVHVASKFESDIILHYKNKEVDVKSILGLMSLAIPEGERVEVVAKGADAAEVITELKTIMTRKG